MTMLGGYVEGHESSSVLKLRGLPYEAKETDVHSFFRDFNLLHVHLCRRNGQTTGEAYVQLETEEAAEKARTALDRQAMGRRYIEIFPAKQTEMKKRRAWESQITGYVLRMRGLPFNASQQDIYKFFDGIKISQNRDSILLTCDTNKRPSGEAFVEFPTDNARNEALLRDRKMIGHRYIELFPATKADVDKALSQNRYNMKQGENFIGRYLGNQGIQAQTSALFSQTQPIGCHLDVADMLRGLNLGAQSSPSVEHCNGFSGLYPADCSNGIGVGLHNPIVPFVAPPLSAQSPRVVTPPSTGFLPVPGNNLGMYVGQWAPPFPRMPQQTYPSLLSPQPQQKVFLPQDLDGTIQESSFGMVGGAFDTQEINKFPIQQPPLEQLRLEKQIPSLQKVSQTPYLEPNQYDSFLPMVGETGGNYVNNYPIASSPSPYPCCEDLLPSDILNQDLLEPDPTPEEIARYLRPGDIPLDLLTFEQVPSYQQLP